MAETAHRMRLMQQQAVRPRVSVLYTTDTLQTIMGAALFDLALNAGADGDHHACMAYLEEVLEREPCNARAIYLMAVQHAELGLTQRAIAGIKRALSIEPDLEIARFQLGLLLMFDSNRPDDAKDYLERLCVSQNLALRAYSEAMIAMADNEPGLARQKLAVGLSESAPDSPLSLLMRGLFARMSGPACDIRLPG
jgi:tetratricopeptide (TPR) repeat protein